MATLTIKENFVSKISSATLQLGRSGGTSRPWVTDHCFQLFVQSPYKVTDTNYQTFREENPPVCTPTDPNLGYKVECEVQKPDTLRVTFTEMTQIASM